MAESGAAGLSSVREHIPDLILLDVMMPGMDGFDVLRRLRAAGDTIPVILLTARDTDASQIEGLNIGADDCVPKPVSFDVLLARIRAVQWRRGASVSNHLRFANLSLDVERFSVKRGERAIQLTNLEFKLLHEFLEQPERVMNKQRLLDRVWGVDFVGDENVVEVYVRQLRHKLEAEGEVRLIQTIRNVGCVLRAS